MATSGSFNTTGYDGRYLTFTWALESQSIENNTSTISWTLKGAGNGSVSWYNAGNFKVVINGVTVYSSSTRIKLYNGTVVSSGTLTINHLSNGNKTFEASAEAGIYYVAVNCSGSGVWSLPQINRYATINRVENFTDEGTPSIAFNNPNNNKLKLSIGVTGNTEVVTRTVTAPRSPYAFELTSSERNALRALTPNSNSLNITYSLSTMSGNTVLNTVTATAKMTIVNANPTIGTVSYQDTNSATTAITGDPLKIIQNNSTVLFTISSLASLKSATLTRVEVTVNSVTVSSNLSGSSINNKTISFGTINSSSNLSASVKLTDSRGNTTTKSINITMLAWETPTAIITCARENNYYTETDLKVNALYTALGGANTITIQYQYKEEGSSSWSALQTIQDDVTTTINLDNTKAWDIKVIVADLLGSTTYNLSVDIGIPIIYFDRILRSVGIDCFPVDPESLEVKGENIYKALFFTSGDLYSVNGRIVDNGYITTNSTSISFTVTMPKSMKYVTPTITELKVNGRHVGGGHIFGSYSASGYDVLSDPNITVSLTKEDDYITISLKNSTAWNVTNNTPVSMALESFKVSFA